MWQGRLTDSALPAAALSSTADLDTITEDTGRLLQQQMTPEGFKSLMSHIRTEKKKMKRIPVPDMSEHGQ
jgi:hypothetical protein